MEVKVFQFIVILIIYYILLLACVLISVAFFILTVTSNKCRRETIDLLSLPNVHPTADITDCYGTMPHI